MSNSSEIIESSSQLVDYIAAGCKPKSDWRLGTEHEKFGFHYADLTSIGYEGRSGIENILKGLQQFDWQPVYEDGHLIALKQGMSSITLEPGGQLELSGGPLKTVHDTCDEVHTHLNQLKSVAEALGVGFIGLGFQPKWRKQDMHWMPKPRYQIMREYMNKVGSLGQDMMSRSCTVQVNLDYSSEVDMVKKMRVSLALQPIATALFANSPFTDGKPNGYLSYRSHLWEDTDPDRTGILPFVFNDSMGFDAYVEYMLDVPMYFVRRNNDYIDASGQNFRDFLQRRLPALPGELPTMIDWEDHLTTAFPEVRLKRFLEMRGADAGPWRRLCALPALWVGLLYSEKSLQSAWELVESWTHDEHQYLRSTVPVNGLKTVFRDQTLQDLALDVLKLSEQGLVDRAQLNSKGKDESFHLDSLWEIAQSGITPAERKLEAYHGSWKQSVDPIFLKYAY